MGPPLQKNCRLMATWYEKPRGIIMAGIGRPEEKNVEQPPLAVLEKSRRGRLLHVFSGRF
jgi:hypothetical protein